ncbi:hypothetical protein GCM10010331_49100 [Streptomyces xanthochromogenes]|uniref:hypothetical protein n=1 Tax=Streptomyces xanthochromogenes TaxID=67384 RepID=UPI001675E3F5|nr:hypothetical protein [Streptomyces xanthochromogenes]GHB55454.1 hypothetical protein GCM10010331_49100 [Streptomyces xanthochromogenes]
MSSADAVARETAWLTAYDPADGLPALLTTDGGPFDIVQGYLPRTPVQRRCQLYVMRRRLQEVRTAHVRRMARHQIELRIIWPASSPTGAAETPQQALDNAIELVLQRIGGLMLDKTHGGRFLSVAEDPAEVSIDFADPEPSLRDRADLTCVVSYSADDIEING